MVPYRSEFRERSPTFLKASIERLGLFSLIVFLVIVSLPAQLIPTGVNSGSGRQLLQPDLDRDRVFFVLKGR
jgi:hypothetical protein